MSKLRKLMAVIVSVAMLVSLFVAPAFAEQTMTDIEVCELLDVLRGTGDGLTAEYLASKPTRYQAARLFLRLQGLEEEAIAFEGAANFSDVEALADWQLAPENKALIAYLYANSELGFIGYTDGTFRPFNEITAMEYYKVLLTALGYEQGEDFEYGEDMLEFAAGLGLSEVAAVEEFTIRHLATATVEGLKAVVKDSDETLLEKLVADGVIDEDDAIATGLLGEVGVALEVEEMYADNLAEVYVVFNQKLDSDTVSADYFKVLGANVDAATLLDDEVTVKLTVNFDKAVDATNGANYDVEITDDVMSIYGTTFEEDYEGSLRVFDNELPYITGIRLTGPKTIEITYSEPMEIKPTVKINKGVYGCSVGDIKSVTNKVIVTIAASRLPEGDYTLAISDAKDFAGFKMDADEWTLEYAEDDSPITAEVTSAKQSEVKVKFNKPVKLTDNPWTYFYHTFSKWTPDEGDTRAKGGVSPYDGEYYDSYTLTFTKDPIPADMDTDLVIKYKGEDGTKIKDAWGNELDSNIIIPISVSADLTPPTVVGEVEVVDSQNIKIYFSEALNEDSAKEKDNYVVEDADGEEVDIKTIGYAASGDDYVVTITFKDELSGDYTIVISGVTDNSVNENKIDETSRSFFVGDTKAPDMSKVEVTAIEGTGDDKDIIYVYYPEKMATEGKYSVLDPENYLLDNDDLDDDAELELFGSTGTVVKITLPKDTFDNEDFFEDGVDDEETWTGITLTIGRVADLAGNVTPRLSYVKPIKGEAGPVITAIEQTAANRLTVTVNKILESVLADAFVFVVNSDEENPFVAAGIEEWYVDGSETIIEVILDADMLDELGGYGEDSGKLLIDPAFNVDVKIDGEFIVAESGKTATDATLQFGDGEGKVAFIDAWIPTYKEMTVSADTYKVTLVFSEDLDATKASYYAYDLVIKDHEGNTLVAGDDFDYTTTVNGNELTINFKKEPDLFAGVDDEAYYTIASKATITYIKDKSGNLIEAFDAVSVEPED